MLRDDTDAQEKRAYAQYSELSTPLLKNTFLQSMKDQNEVQDTILFDI